jgi:hypothetical protein
MNSPIANTIIQLEIMIVRESVFWQKWDHKQKSFCACAYTNVYVCVQYAKESEKTRAIRLLVVPGQPSQETTYLIYRSVPSDIPSLGCEAQKAHVLKSLSPGGGIMHR